MIAAPRQTSSATAAGRNCWDPRTWNTTPVASQPTVAQTQEGGRNCWDPRTWNTTPVASQPQVAQTKEGGRNCWDPRTWTDGFDTTPVAAQPGRNCWDPSTWGAPVTQPVNPAPAQADVVELTLWF